jgi:hypothetical protein
MEITIPRLPYPISASPKFFGITCARHITAATMSKGHPLTGLSLSRVAADEICGIAIFYFLLP